MALLNTLVKRGTPLTMFRHDTPVPVAGQETKTTINVRIAKERAPVDMWAYRDAQSVQYNRVPMAKVAAKYSATIYADFPVQVQELFSSYLNKAGLYDRGDQVQDAAITGPGTVTLKALPDSFMLTGEFAFTVKQATKYLIDVITETVLTVFDPTKNMNGAPEEHLVNSLNVLNAKTLPRPIVPSEVRFGKPVLLDEYDGLNTEVEIFGNNSEVYLGSILLTYHRVDFAWLLDGSQMVLSGPSRVTTDILLDKIRAKTGFTMTSDDVVYQVYDPVESGTMSTLTVFINEESLRYVGEITIDYTAE